MKPLIRGWLIVGTLLLGATTPIRAQDLPQVQSDEQRERELRIMSRVLEESLDRAGLGAWFPVMMHSSPFESRVRAAWLPGVGAIFTVPVNIAVIEHGATVSGAPRPTPAPADDLWEKNAQQGAGMAMPGMPGMMPGMQGMPPHGGMMPGMGPVDMAGPPDQAKIMQKLAMLEAQLRNLSQTPVPDPNEAQELKSKIATLRARMAQLKQGMPGMPGMPGMMPGMMGMPGMPPAFDPQKFQQLRQALIGAVARYGHRLTRLGSDERIYILVEAPGGAPRLGDQTTTTTQSPPFPGAPIWPPVPSALPPPPAQAPGMPGMPGMMMPGMMPGMMPPGAFGPPPTPDHYLIAISRGSLAGPLSPQELTGRIQEWRY